METIDFVGRDLNRELAAQETDDAHQKFLDEKVDDLMRGERVYFGHLGEFMEFADVIADTDGDLLSAALQKALRVTDYASCIESRAELGELLKVAAVRIIDRIKWGINDE